MDITIFIDNLVKNPDYDPNTLFRTSGESADSLDVVPPPLCALVVEDSAVIAKTTARMLIKE